MIRLKSLQRSLDDHGLDNLIVSDPMAIKYLLGHYFTCGERLLVLLIQKGKSLLFLNDLFPYENKDIEIIRFNDVDDSVAILSNYLVKGSIGIDSNWPSGFLLRLMQYHQGQYIEGSYLIDKMRIIKDEDEQQKMIKASKINDFVMGKVAKYLKVGVSEKEVSDYIKEQFKLLNCEISFEPIVAFGKNCADPHAVCSMDKLKESESIIIDMGCIYDDYCSDMTRTFFIKDNSLKEVYDIVLKANRAAIKMVRPNIRFQDIDKAARDVIIEAGYGDKFIHRTGHGIGLEVHEKGDVSASNDQIVQEGMCFSIEPGIYLPNIGGIRIEDLVLVTKDGCLVLNEFPKDEEVIGGKNNENIRCN